MKIKVLVHMSLKHNDHTTLLCVQESLSILYNENTIKIGQGFFGMSLVGLKNKLNSWLFKFFKSCYYCGAIILNECPIVFVVKWKCLDLIIFPSESGSVSVTQCV